MTRRAKLVSVTLALAALTAEAAGAPLLFADQSGGKNHPHKIAIQVGKVTKSQDHPKGGGKGH